MQMTDRFLAEIRRSHRYYSYVDVTGPSLETIRLPATDGSVKCDGSAKTRRSVSVKCIDPTGLFTPKDQHGILTPYGTELRPYRGVKYDDGTVEVAPLGVFRLSRSSIKDSFGGSPDIQLEGYDLSRTISRDKFTKPYTVDEDTNVLDAIKAIVARTFPGQQYDAISTTVTVTAPRVYKAGDDPWEKATELATSMGAEMYYDADGILVIAPPTDIHALPAPVFSYVEGDQCTMLDVGRDFKDEPGYNGVILTGESVGDEKEPVRGEAWDEEPSSPTYRYGPYGEVPMFVTDKNVKTEDEANAAAHSLLAAQLGFSVQLSITSTVNPAFEAGDVVKVVRERMGISGLYALDAFNVPLAKSGSQGLTLRQKQVAS